MDIICTTYHIPFCHPSDALSVNLCQESSGHSGDRAGRCVCCKLHRHNYLRILQPTRYFPVSKLITNSLNHTAYNPPPRGPFLLTQR